MKLNDAVWGALFALLSAALLVHIRNFPTIPGQNVGPALFPGTIAVGLAVCAALLIIKGLAARRLGGERARWGALDAWVHSRRHVVGFALIIAVNVFYIFVVDKLGFIITGSVYLLVLFLAFGVRVKAAVPIAILVTVGMHYAFYKLLKVPLPWGLLQGIAY